MGTLNSTEHDGAEQCVADDQSTQAYVGKEEGNDALNQVG
jgi:hypothetical protein